MRGKGAEKEMWVSIQRTERKSTPLFKGFRRKSEKLGAMCAILHEGQEGMAFKSIPQNWVR